MLLVCALLLGLMLSADHIGAQSVSPAAGSAKLGNGGPAVLLGNVYLVDPLLTHHGVLYFVGAVPVAQQPLDKELWRTDGTVAGTYLVKDLMPGSNPSFPSDMISYRGSLVFLAAGRLWRTDGTTAGTVMIANSPSIESAHYLGYAGYRFEMLGNTLFLINNAGAARLWRLDDPHEPMVAVDSMLNDLSVVSTIVYQGQIFFLALKVQYPYTANPFELWSSDGTTSGTRKVATAGYPKIYWSEGDELRYTSLLIANQRLFWGALSESVWNGVVGYQLWSSDGTSAGTSRLNPHDFDMVAQAASYQDKLYIVDNNTRDLWVSDGTATGTHLFTPTVKVAGYRFWFVNGRLVFEGEANGDPNTWVTDGTAAGTTLLNGLPPTGDVATIASGSFYISSSATYTAPVQLIKSDATEAGTAAVAPLDLDRGSIVGLPGRLLITTHASDGSSSSIWLSDGTTPGTQPIQTHPGYMYNVHLINDYLIYGTVTVGSRNNQLWAIPYTSPLTQKTYLPSVTQ